MASEQLYECGDSVAFIGHRKDGVNYWRNSGDTFSLAHLEKDTIKAMIDAGQVKKHVKAKES